MSEKGQIYDKRDKVRKIMAVIQQSVKTRHVTPTLGEIANEVGCNRGYVHRLVKELATENKIGYIPHTKRGIRWPLSQSQPM